MRELTVVDRAMRAGVGAALVLWTAGCHLARMEAPREMAGVAPLPVSGRQGFLFARQRPRFGDYDTHEVRRSWVRSREVDGGFVATGVYRQRYGFVLREKGVDRWAATCETVVNSATARLPAGLELGPLARLTLRCALATADSAVRARVDWNVSGLVPRGSGAVEGLARRVEIQPSYRVEHAWLPWSHAAGYLLRDGDRVVAAVDALSSGRVFFDPGLGPEERTALAAVAVVFLLFDDLHEHYDPYRG